MEKLISFSLWGNNESYYKGVFENHEIINKLLPDYKMLLHIDENFPSNKLLNIKSLNIKIIVEKNLGNFHGTYWRFFSFENEGITLIRDLDSRISNREIVLIRAWESSNKKFHIIRDCENFHTKAILAGLCGCKGGIKNIRYLIEQFASFEKYGEDEEFLEKYLFPIIKDDCLEHTSTSLHFTKNFIQINKSWDTTFIGQKIY